jgi:hypothetical protein
MNNSTKPELVQTITLFRRLPSTGWQAIRRYNRYYMPSQAELAADDETRVSYVICPGCHKRMTRIYINEIHECRASVEQPDYTPAYKIARAQRKIAWQRKNDTTLAAQSGTTPQTQDNSYVVDYRVEQNQKHIGREDSDHTAEK